MSEKTEAEHFAHEIALRNAFKLIAECPMTTEAPGAHVDALFDYIILLCRQFCARPEVL